ncbi:hypothetical protein CR513_25430, partial [Mucuna pruriens]
MKCIFLEKFFIASRTTTIRKEICGIRQHSGETLHEYWERFNKLYATYPHHQINEQLLIHYFYEVDNLRLENQLTELTSLVRQLVVGQHQPSIASRLVNTMSHLQSVGSGNLPSQTILNMRRNASVVTPRSGKELPPITPQEPRPIDTDSELDANSQVPPTREVCPIAISNLNFFSEKTLIY